MGRGLKPSLAVSAHVYCGFSGDALGNVYREPEAVIAESPSCKCPIYWGTAVAAKYTARFVSFLFNDIGASLRSTALRDRGSVSNRHWSINIHRHFVFAAFTGSPPRISVKSYILENFNADLKHSADESNNLPHDAAHATSILATRTEDSPKS